MKKAIPAIVLGLVIVILIIVCGRLFMIGSFEVCFDGPSSVAGEQILGCSGVELGDSIFSMNETEVRERIESAFPARNVLVYDIERVFPNRLVFYVHEREALFAIPDENDGYWLADIDFQLNCHVSADETGNAIVVSGTSVHDTFETEDCRFLASFAGELIKSGMLSEVVLKRLFDGIELTQDTLTAHTVKGDRQILRSASLSGDEWLQWAMA